jgi:hypothetical protein
MACSVVTAPYSVCMLGVAQRYKLSLAGFYHLEFMFLHVEIQLSVTFGNLPEDSLLVLQSGITVSKLWNLQSVDGPLAVGHRRHHAHSFGV